jgi:DNA-binding Lrp family transcriptional regulator
MYQINTLQPERISSAEINKIRQKKKILSLLRTGGFTSAPELGKRLKISLPTSIVLLNDLISSGYVKNIGIGESSGGRKPQLYGLPEDGYYVVTCDISRYSANIAIIDCYNKFVTPVIQIDTHIDDPLIVDKIYKASYQLINDYHISEDRVYGIGIDMPGLINSKTGIN